MTQGYLISSRALEIGVRLRCQKLHAVFIGSMQKLIRSAIFEGLLGRCYFQFKALWTRRREPRYPLWSRSEAEASLKCMLWQHNVSPLPPTVSLSLPLAHLPLYT